VGPNPAVFKPDYDGKRGKPWVHGKFKPATGQVLTVITHGMDSASLVQLLQKIMTAFPAE